MKALTMRLAHQDISGQYRARGATESIESRKLGATSWVPHACEWGVGDLVMFDADGQVSIDGVYRDQFAPLVRVAFLLTGSRAAAEDAVHDAFLRCAPRFATLDHPASYLRAAVVNECRAQHRRAVRFGDAHGPEPSSELPYEAVQTREALLQLSERRRLAVVLRYYLDLPDDEIATILGCRQATVRSLVRRGLLQLREALT
jgi:RNA polymerase sigma factor (sigma-70 family)